MRMRRRPYVHVGWDVYMACSMLCFMIYIGWIFFWCLFFVFLFGLFFFAFPWFFLGKTAVSLRFGRIWRDCPWFSYEKTCFLLFLGLPRENSSFLTFWTDLA